MNGDLLLVGIGGAAGSIMRYVLQRHFAVATFPLGTFSVNIIGCLLIGMLWALLAKGSSMTAVRLLLITGFCGGFTTFSAFTQEGVQMLLQNKWLLFFIYAISSVAGGLLATFAGFKLFN